MSSVSLPGVPAAVVIGMIPAGELVEALGIVEAVPILEMPRFDERQWCARVLRFQAGELAGIPDDWRDCRALRGRLCERQGGGALCAFHEPDNASVWRRAAGWRLLEYPDGSTAIARASTAAETAGEIGARVVGAEVVVR